MVPKSLVVWDAFKEALKGERAVLTIMHAHYFAGSRYPCLGLGDRGNSSLACKIRIALNYSLTGVSFWHGTFGSFELPVLDKETNVQLQPYIYTYWKEAVDTGISIFRPLMFEYPEDPETYELGNEFLFGTVWNTLSKQWIRQDVV